ncbi:hypothetical protein [Nocardia alni]|uniref:hypothetical protein n=1 Tax=Nocardia alni TaxID=2815723 RepID=UPI001C23DD31|nr:hypothetical protein [Nocardia alni]
MTDDEIGRETAAALRTTLQVAGLLAEHWSRTREARAREATARHHAAARHTERRLQAERRTVETYLRATRTREWWATATRAHITEAWCTARQWETHSTLAADTLRRLDGQIRERYGIDLTHTVPATAPADPTAISHLLDRAAWRHATHTDNPDTTIHDHTEHLAAQALYALVAKHSNATTAYRETGNHAAFTNAGIAEAGLNALGEPGAAWLREFDRDPHLAYARVLIAPDTPTRLALHDSAQRLHQLDNETHHDDTQRAEHLAALDQLGEPGRLWLDTWRTDPATAYERVLHNPHLQQELATRAENMFNTQQRAAEAALRERSGNKWFATAGRAEILRAWDTARTWREHSPLAATTHDRLNDLILTRFGVDLTAHDDAEVDRVSEMIDHAAWRVAAAKMDTTVLEAAEAETQAQQRHERDQLYQLVTEHAEATAEYRAHGDNQQDATRTDPGRDQRAAAIGTAEIRLRDLGPAGQQWVREFDTDPHRAYARVLIAPDPLTRRHLHAAVQQLHDSDLIGPTRTPRPTREQAIAAVEATGEPGQRWLNRWHINPHTAIAKILEDPYTATEIKQTPAPTARRKTNRRTTARRGPDRHERAPRPRTPSWTATDLEEARAWLGKHDPEWLSVRAWKLRNMPTEYGRDSVHESIVDRHHRATHPDPAIRETVRLSGITDHNDTDRSTAIRAQLDDRNVSPALQRIRMNLEQDNAVPLNAVITKTPGAPTDHDTTSPDLEPTREQQEYGHER